MYQAYLTSQGYVPRPDADGDVDFKFEGRRYCIMVDEDDEAFFHLVLPNFWRLDSEAEREQAVKAAALVTERAKVAKVFLVRDNVFASVEMFCDPPECVTEVFARCLHALAGSARHFAEAMREMD
jgi:hypothetical protein